MTRKPATLLALAAAVLTATLGVHSPARAEDTLIQPGARISAPAGCTLNFVFETTSGVRYIGTAGHCTSAVNDVVRDGDGGRIGVVVFREMAGVGGDDFALIKIDTARYGEVNPAMRHWGGPTGYVRSNNGFVGDRVLISGYGIGFSTSSRTRGRAGALMSMDTRTYRAWIPAIFGDSGGGVLRAGGEAVGVVSGIAPLTGSTLIGPTVERVLQRLASNGIHVRLVTAPYTGLIL